MSRVFVQDRQTYQTTSREITSEGFLLVPGRVAKTGTQQYLRRELGLDGNPNETVTVYRPENEVFSDESLASYDGIDLTVFHPKELVNPKNYKETSVGVVRGKARRDGDFVVADLLFKDQSAIDKITKDGFVELSAGYTAEYVAVDGVAPDGTPYQYEQRGILLNHVASLPVNSARAGRQARIFDHDQKEITMSKVTLDSGREVEVQDAATALLISDTIDRLRKQVTDAEKAKDEAEAKAEKAEAKADMKEEEAEKAKKETSDAAITARIAEIVAVKDKAATIDSAYAADGVDTLAIMRGVLKGIRSTVDWDSKSQDYVQAAFDMAHEAAKEGKSVKNAEQLRKIAADGAAGANQAPAKSAADAYKERFAKGA